MYLKKTPNNNEDDAELTTHKKDIYLQKTAINVNELMNELRLVLKKDDYFRNDQWINANIKNIQISWKR